MINKLVAEFLGTLFFLYVILATGDAVAIGLGLMAAIFILGKKSGGHFNPAVSVMMAMAGKMNERFSSLCYCTDCWRFSSFRII